MKNERIIKNLIIRNKKKLIAVASAFVLGTIVMCNSCGSKKEPSYADVDVDANILEIVNNNADEIYLDDILNDNNNKIEVVCLNDLLTNESNKTKITLKDGISKLDTYLHMYNKIDFVNSIDKNIVSNLKKEDNEYYNKIMNEVINYSEEDINNLIEQLENDKLTAIERSRIETKLVFLKDCYARWISKNGLEIAEEYLLINIKAIACNLVGLEAKDYNKCTITIPESNQNKTKAKDKYYIIDVKENGVTFKCVVKGNEEDPLYACLRELVNIQRRLTNDCAYQPNRDDADFCEKALLYGKLSLYGEYELELNKDKYIVNSYRTLNETYEDLLAQEKVNKKVLTK